MRKSRLRLAGVHLSGKTREGRNRAAVIRRFGIVFLVAAAVLWFATSFSSLRSVQVVHDVVTERSLEADSDGIASSVTDGRDSTVSSGDYGAGDSRSEPEQADDVRRTELTPGPRHAPRRVDESTRGAPADFEPGVPVPEREFPFCDRVITFVDKKRNGLGAQLNRVVEAATLARSVRAVFWLPNQKYWNYGCGRYKTWQCYFVTGEGECLNAAGELEKIKTVTDKLSLDDCTSLQSVPDGAGCWISGGEDAERFVHDEVLRLSGIHSGYTTARATMHEMMRESAREVIKLNAAVQNVLHKVEAALGFKQGYVGVHIRRGDKNLEVKMKPTRLFAELVLKLAGDTRNVFVATDDFQEALEMRTLLAPHGFRVVTLASEARTGHDQRLHNRKKPNRRLEETVEFLVEMCVLAESELFIGAMSSNAARLVHVMRSGPPNTTISVDDRWMPGVAYHSFGESYCFDSDANSRACTEVLQRPPSSWNRVQSGGTRALSDAVAGVKH